ncbi:MAG: DegT/DnrJ/EryC1/StrS family aminotransferase, partial [Planctomycetaceae bacterium]
MDRHMWPRKRLDIGWTDIAAGRWACATRWDRQQAVAKLQHAWPVGVSTDHNPETPRVIPTLSVRSGLHLLLGQLDWPAGSEILMSAMTIPGMARIVRHHNYVPVPVDLDLDTAAPTLQPLQHAVTKNTRGLILAHLLGTRIPLAEILHFTTEHRIDVLEDCALVFVGDERAGTPGCLDSMFSFGTINTATALGGGLLAIRDEQLADRVRDAQNQWPVQSRLGYAFRLARSLVLKILAYRPPFAVFCLGCRLLRIDYDRLLNNAVRGFPAERLVERISRAPSAPLLHLLRRRIRNFDQQQLAQRIQMGRRLRRETEQHVALFGHRSSVHTYWAFPVFSRDPSRLIAALARNGFDATQGNSMEIVDAPDG